MDPPRLPFRPYVSKAERINLEKQKSHGFSISRSKQLFEKVEIRELFQTQTYVLEHQRQPFFSKASRRCKRYQKVSKSPVWNARWNSRFSHLLAVTCGESLQLYDVFGDFGCDKPVYQINESCMVKCCCWSKTNHQILSITVQGDVKVYDFLHDGKCSSRLKVKNQPTCACWFTEEENLVLIGGSNSSLSAFDIRSGQEAMRYVLSGAGDVLSMDCFPDGNRFVASYNEVNRQSAQHNLVVWDFRSGAKLSDQIFHERYSCPCVRVHPSGASFVAQTTGNYAARFNSIATQPYRLDRYVKYKEHQVYEFGTRLDVSPDGKHLVSGSADGSVSFYNYKSAQLLHRIDPLPRGYGHQSNTAAAILDVRCHPTIPGVVALTDWNGAIQILE